MPAPLQIAAQSIGVNTDPPPNTSLSHAWLQSMTVFQCVFVFVCVLIYIVKYVNSVCWRSRRQHVDIVHRERRQETGGERQGARERDREREGERERDRGREVGGEGDRVRERNRVHRRRTAAVVGPHTRIAES